MTVRAKFRCLSILNTWEKRIVAELRPVNGSGENPENKKFWKYTPTGIAELHGLVEGPFVAPFAPAAYYYVDLEPESELSPEDRAQNQERWHLGRMDRTEHQLEVTLSLPFEKDRWGWLKMGIDNKEAWGPFLAADVGSIWRVTFTPAEAK